LRCQFPDARPCGSGRPTRFTGTGAASDPRGQALPGRAGKRVRRADRGDPRPLREPGGELAAGCPVRLSSFCQGKTGRQPHRGPSQDTAVLSAVIRLADATSAGCPRTLVRHGRKQPMSTDFDSLSNRGEYMSAHYFAEQMGADLRKTLFGTWSSRETDKHDPRPTPRAIVRSLL